jgi:hypothetical protein
MLGRQPSAVRQRQRPEHVRVRTELGSPATRFGSMPERQAVA